jgi:hypothetical protein
MNRKSPSIHASENPVGKIKIGNDKNNWIILEKNNIKKWYLLGKYKKYCTEDNGNKKYKIIINDNHIYIFSNSEGYDILTYEIKNYKNIFIGKNTKKYRIYDGLFIGSSILVEIKKNTYIFIGNKITKFITNEPIIEFHSIMSNSSVVYPFALTNNYVYLMIENVYLKRDFDDNDPYEVYYDFKKKWKRSSYKYKLEKL